jgi:putative peptidoglycan lipid II flippase
VRVLFSSFTDAEATATAMVLQAYVLGLLPYGLVKIFAPVFYGLDRSRIPLLASIAAVVVNVGFNAATYKLLGTPGLALGTTLGAVVNIFVLRLSFARVVGAMAGVSARRLVSLLLANAVLGAVVWAAWLGVEQAIAVVGWELLLRVIGLAVVVPIGFFLYVGLLRAFDYPGAALLWGLPGKLLRRFRR